jgi:hypothetical protein
MLRWLSRSRAATPSAASGTGYRRHGAVVAAGEGGRTVLMDPVRGEYLGLDEVGTRIWELLPEHPTAAALAERLCEEYEAPREQLEADATAFLRELAGHGLVVRG